MVRGGPAVVTTVSLIASIVLCAIAIWVVVPPIHASLLPLAVGAPEITPWLLVSAVVVCGATYRLSGLDLTARAAFNLAAAAGLLFAYPLARMPFVLSRFDRSMEQSLGAQYEDAIPAAARATFRPHAISAVDLARGIAASDVDVQRGVEFARPGGHPLTLDVYRPRLAGPHPVLVQIYGGAWQRGEPGDNGSFATWFASRGYVVVAIDYRHAPQAQWPEQIADVRAAIGWIVAHSAGLDADVHRVALLGRSAGAQLALVAAYQAGVPLVRAVVSYYGPTDLVEGWRVPPRPDPMAVRGLLEAYLGGTPDSAPDTYRAASPTAYVSARVPPTLLIYGSRDHVVSPAFARSLDARLRQAGAVSVLLEVPWAEHAFDAVPNGISAQISLYYTERFLAWALR